MNEEETTVSIIKSECLYVCKCCLEDGDFLDLWAEYLNDDQLEIYGEMLNNCFNLMWEKPSEDYIECICYTCIERLKHAAFFKETIEASKLSKLVKKKYCSCCLQSNGKMKNLWTMTKIDDENEVIGKMFVDCFALSWEKPSSGIEYVCEDCIGKLQHTSLFKTLIYISEKKLAEHYHIPVDTSIFNEIESRIELKIENEEEEEEELDDTFNVKAEPQDDHNLEYPIDSDDPDYTEEAVASSDEDFEPKIQKRKKQIVEKDVNPEWSDLAVQACLKGELTAAEAARFYSLPKKTIENKINKIKRKPGSANSAVDKPASSSQEEEDEPPKLPKKRRNTKKRNYEPEVMEQAVDLAVYGEMSSSEAARRFGLPQKTVYYKTVARRADLGMSIKHKPKSYLQFVDEVRTILTYTNATPFKTKNCHYYCVYCYYKNEPIDDPEELRRHTRECHQDIRLSYVGEILKPMYLNEIIRFDIKDFKCTRCDINLDEWNDLYIHMKAEHNISFDEAVKRAVPYVLTLELELRCALCQERFCGITYMDHHMNCHYDSYICSDCGQTLLTKQRLRTHSINHKTDRHTCDQCSLIFKQKKLLVKHMQEDHNAVLVSNYVTDVSEIYCEACGKYYKNGTLLDIHMRRTHKNEKRHDCPSCDMKFFNRGELKKHMVTHTKEKKYECVLCHKKLGSSWALRHHYKVHKEVKSGEIDIAQLSLR